MRRDRDPNSAIEYETPMVERGKAQFVGSVEGGDAGPAFDRELAPGNDE